MTIIRRLQWLISLSVLIYGVALFGEIGVTAIIFVGAGLGYCALAAGAARLTIIPLLVVLMANAGLGFVSWRMWMGSFKSVIANARYQGHEAGYVDFLTLDGIASSIILILLAWYVGAIMLKWKALGRRTWW